MNLDRIITIEMPVKVKNSYGEESITWSIYAVLWANVNYKGGREGFYARQVVAVGDVVFKVRYTSGITPAMRILFDNNTYDIIATNEIDRKQFLEITTKSHDNERY